MKIIISPSKTQNPSKSDYISDKSIIFQDKYDRIVAILKKLSKKDLKKIMKIKIGINLYKYWDIFSYFKDE